MNENENKLLKIKLFSSNNKTMSNDEKIKEIILKNRPKLSMGSMNTYMASYRKIRKDSGVSVDTEKDIIDNYEKILKYMNDTMTPNIRKSKIASLVIIIDDKKDGDKEKDIALEAFRKQMSVDGTVVNKKYDSQELSDKQKKNFIPLEEVRKIYNELKSQAIPLFKFNNLNKAQFNLLQSYVLLSLYMLIPPRRSTDYAFPFKIRNFDSSPQSVDNYMFNFNRSKKKPASFVFNTYKNSNRMGRQIIDIPKPLEKIITEWSKFNKSDYLLVNNAGNNVAPSKITLWLNQIFNKQISSSMLRHIFLSDKYANVNLQDLKDTAESMGQSDITTALRYVQKNSDQVVEENQKK